MNLRQVRKKIKTIGNVSKITKTMQMVSAVKMKKSQQEAREGHIYSETLEQLTQHTLLSSSIDKIDIALYTHSFQEATKGNIYIIISSNKGLCGSFNFNLLKLLLKEVNFTSDAFVVVGKKMREFIHKTGGHILADFSSFTPFINHVSSLFSLVIKKYQEKKYHGVYIVSNRFISTMTHETKKAKMIPLDISVASHKISSKEYILEPSGQELIISLIEDMLMEKLRAAFRESEAAEHSARMLAMKNATDNAQDIIYTLTLVRNKLRQESITYELLDIIAAKTSTE